MTLITLTGEQLTALDLTPVADWLATLTPQPIPLADPVQFAIDFPREPLDPRELSEIPEVRLWFLRLDSRYPWFPLYVDWSGGELARYAAMVIPHEFHRTEGIQFNPEALDLFIMHKVFILGDRLRSQGQEFLQPLKDFALMFGYDLDEAFLKQL